MGDPAVKLAPSTVEEFLVWEGEQPDRHEFVKGEVRAMVGATVLHERVVRRLLSLLSAHLDGTPCEVFTSNVKLQVGKDLYYPDVKVSCDKRDKEPAALLIEHPVLLIEVLSPSTEDYDRGEKFEAYRAIGELTEVVFVDMKARTLVLRQRASGDWRETVAPSVELKSIDYRLDIETLLQS
jgi:Uma2 family endonuclease